jgi:hypothetical protein
LRSARQFPAIFAIAVIAVLAHGSATGDAQALSLKNMTSGVFAGGNACVRSCQRQRNKCVIATKNLSACSRKLQRCLEVCIRRSEMPSGRGQAKAATLGRAKNWLRCKMLDKC